jgi:RNase H-fold protein (predicted Holliday junction resolvase)
MTSNKNALILERNAEIKRNFDALYITATNGESIPVKTIQTALKLKMDGDDGFSGRNFNKNLSAILGVELITSSENHRHITHLENYELRIKEIKPIKTKKNTSDARSVISSQSNNTVANGLRDFQQTGNIDDIILLLKEHAEKTEHNEMSQLKQYKNDLKNDFDNINEQLIIERCGTSQLKLEIERLKKEQIEHNMSVRTDTKQYIDSLKKEQMVYIDNMKIEFSSQFESMKLELTQARNELTQQSQDFTAYRNMTIRQTAQYKLDENKENGLSVGVDLCVEKFKIFKIKPNPEKNCKYSENPTFS